jgi:uncharacterized protein (DUF2147 family)
MFVLALIAAPPTQAAAPISGRWFTDGQDSVVELGPCGPFICGKIVKVMKTAPGGGIPIDRNNPDPALRTRPIQGIFIFRNFKDGGSEWTGGTLYDPRAGKEYKGTLARTPDGNLKVTGCFGPFCRSKTFTPVM